MAAAAAGRAVDLRGPTGDPENELTISITHKGRDGETLLEILFRGGKEEPTKRDLAPAPARLEKQRMMLFVDVDGCNYGGGKDEGKGERKRGQRKITCRDVTREMRRSPWSEPRHDRSLFLLLMRVIRFHIPNDDYDDDGLIICAFESSGCGQV